MEVVGGVSLRPSPAPARIRTTLSSSVDVGGRFALRPAAPRGQLPARRARALVVEARGRSWSERQMQQQRRMPQLPKIEDDGNPRFVIFIRTSPSSRLRRKVGLDCNHLTTRLRRKVGHADVVDLHTLHAGAKDPSFSWSDLVEVVMTALIHCPTISWMDLVEAVVSTGNLHRLNEIEARSGMDLRQPTSSRGRNLLHLAVMGACITGWMGVCTMPPSTVR